MVQNPMNPINQNQKNVLNYKIAKCKNWEKDGNCKYGIHCTFAHGDAELRNKNDNLNQMQQSMGVMMQPLMLDMNAMMQMGQMNQFQGIDMNQMGLNPMIMGIPMNSNMQQQMNNNLNNNNQNEQKE